MNQKINVNEKCMKYIYLILAATMLLTFVVLSCNNVINTINNGDYVFPIDITGEYWEYGSDEKTAFDNYDAIKSKSSQIMIKGHVKETVARGTKIMMYLYRVDVQIFVNGLEMYNCNGRDSDIIRWDSFDSPGITPLDDVYIVVNQLSAETYKGSCAMFLDKMCYGTNYGLLGKQIRGNFIKIVVSAIIFIIGLAVLVTMGAMKLFHIPVFKGNMICSLLLMAGATCTMIDYEYITLVFKNARMVNDIDFMMQVVLCILLLVYLKVYIITEKYLHIINNIVSLICAVLIFLFSLELIGFINHSDFFKILTLPIVVCFVVELVLLIKDYYIYKEKYIKFVLLSEVELVVFSMFELIHYFMTNYFLIYVFQAALMVFTIVQFTLILIYTKNNMKRAAKAKQLEEEAIRQESINAKLENELTQNQIAIMLSQIQPHFLYNALNTIHYLCRTQPELAAQVVEKFSMYLRGNMDSLKQKKLIPLENELNHLKNYLTIEQLRFPEVEIIYDIRAKEIKIPTLTLQPLVENAIKYGASQKEEEDGYVKISSWEDEKFSYLSVTDNGYGFDPLKLPQDGRTHIGLSNTRKRLESMCKGTLVIDSKIGEGTCIKITIPK